MANKLEGDLDGLFKLPLAEFTAARNALATQLKKGGRASDAEFVKTLAKPPVSAWAVNQLYWQHRTAFEKLLSAGERFRQAQTSRLTRKVADMRVALDARRDALAQLSDLAAELLRDAGHNPSLDTIRRVTTTLEAMSAYGSLPDGPRPGRLTEDVDPPGFETLASFVPSAASTRQLVALPRKPERVAAPVKAKPDSASDARQLKEARQARIAAAKLALQEAKDLLAEARARAKILEAAQKKSHLDAREAEKQREEAEERFQEAKAAAKYAAEHARKVAAEAEEAADAVEEAKRSVEKASKELAGLS